MPAHLRLTLLVLIALACVVARAGVAVGATAKHLKVSRATREAHEQAQVVKYARKFLGVPYRYGGSSPYGGFDCSGFTRFIYAHFGVSLPHYSGAQWNMGMRVSLKGLRPGDVLFFDGLGHVGLYIGHNLFIHAPHTGTRVSISSLTGWYGARFDGARRFF